MAKLSIFIVLLIAFVGANAMSKNSKTCFFSAISGTITLNGKPVSNARIKRVSDDHIDETKTDEHGYFNMPSVFANPIFSFLSRFIPEQFVSTQKVYIYVDGMEHQCNPPQKQGHSKLEVFRDNQRKQEIISCVNPVIPKLRSSRSSRP